MKIFLREIKKILFRSSRETIDITRKTPQTMEAAGFSHLVEARGVEPLHNAHITIGKSRFYFLVSNFVSILRVSAYYVIEVCVYFIIGIQALIRKGVSVHSINDVI